MSTNYPGAADSFDVPSSPGTTPLSSAGSAARNHVTHHRDLGDAITALQNNATKTTHTHDGTGLNGPQLAQANTHQSVDTDNAPTSIHHTLGIGANQAAAGNHLHTGTYVDLSTTQTITGKKAFTGAGANAPQITDFTNMQHTHLTTATGGYIVTPRISSLGAESAHPTTYGSNTTTDFFLTSTFTLPANYGLSGAFYSAWIWDNNPTYSSAADTYFYIGWTTNLTNAVYVSQNGAVAGTSDHFRLFEPIAANTEVYKSLAIPVYIPAISTARQMRLNVRAINTFAPIRASNFTFLGHYST